MFESKAKKWHCEKGELSSHGILAMGRGDMTVSENFLCILWIIWPKLNEWIVMAVVVLIIYGIAKTPKIGGELSKGIPEFKRKKKHSNESESK